MKLLDKENRISSAEIWNAWGYYAVSILCFLFTALYWL